MQTLSGARARTREQQLLGVFGPRLEQLRRISRKLPEQLNAANVAALMCNVWPQQASCRSMRGSLKARLALRP